MQEQNEFIPRVFPKTKNCTTVTVKIMTFEIARKVSSNPIRLKHTHITKLPRLRCF